ncbi:MAG: alanine racemase [Allorhizobium sp.]
MTVSVESTPATDEFATAPLRLTIDLQALADNWRDMAERSGTARTAAVVKADAYGVGIEDAGATLYAAGARDFFVAVPSEGATLRAHAPEASIFVLSGLWPGVEDIFFDNDLIPVIASSEQLTFWLESVAIRGARPCALHVDTGFNRLGLTADEALALSDPAARPAGLMPVLVLSHLACGDDPASPMNPLQCEMFRTIANAFTDVEASLSASAGIFLGPDYHFDLTRPGIALYGGDAVNGMVNPMRPVIKAEARILQVRQAQSGTSVSYGRAHLLSRDSRLAVACVGYADGYLRSLSGAGIPLRGTGILGASGFIGGQPVPVAGRITMDLTIFDVTDLPEGSVSAGDYIELFGKNIALDDVARAAGTIGYEILTDLGLRYERRYIEASD